MLFYYLALAIPVLFTTCWLYTAHICRGSFPGLRNKSICLLIAHPDDEAMFFAPTVLALTEEDLGNHVKILCLSSGDAEKLGETRKRELVHSASVLGLRSSNDVFIIEDPAFPDSMTTSWDPVKVANVLSSAFTPFKADYKSKKQANEISKRVLAPATIDVLITFDRVGISSHPNHISLYHGAVTWLKGMMKDREERERPVILYTLTSTNVLRKYISILDAPFTMLSFVLKSLNLVGSKSKGGPMPSQLMYVSDIGTYRKAQKAMTEAHKSQMRWFRWGWIGVGRYMVVNDLKRERFA